MREQLYFNSRTVASVMSFPGYKLSVIADKGPMDAYHLKVLQVFHQKKAFTPARFPPKKKRQP